MAEKTLPCAFPQWTYSEWMQWRMENGVYAEEHDRLQLIGQSSTFEEWLENKKATGKEDK
ncbi:hypothetical protein [Burkholderia pseudomallei]